MANAVILDNVAHKDLRVRTGHSAAFGDAISQVLVLPTEFVEVQREYPILFRKRSNGEMQSVALLGFDKDENLFLDERGWNARYVPAMQQRGPFLINLSKTEAESGGAREPKISIDLDDPRVGASDGEPLFLKHGGHSPYLEHIARALRVLHQGIALGPRMFAAFEAANLIEPVQIEFALSEREKYKLPDGFATIGLDRLAALDGAVLERLNRTGFLTAAIMVASSLGNLQRLIDLKAARRRAYLDSGQADAAQV